MNTYILFLFFTVCVVTFIADELALGIWRNPENFFLFAIIQIHIGQVFIHVCFVFDLEIVDFIGTKSMQKQHQHMKSQDHPATSTQIH